jgi:hypothetical protein
VRLRHPSMLRLLPSMCADKSLSMHAESHCSSSAAAPPTGTSRRTVNCPPAATRTHRDITDTTRDKSSVVAKKRPRDPDIGYTHPSGVSTEQAMRDQRAAWLAMARSMYVPRQYVRESTIGTMLAEFHTRKGTKCTGCSHVCWKDPPSSFNPLHFMVCDACEDIACGIGAKM